MDEEQLEKDTIWVVTSEPIATRGGGRQAKALKVEWLAENVNLFIGQMGALLEQTPEKIGKFQFEEQKSDRSLTCLILLRHMKIGEHDYMVSFLPLRGINFSGLSVERMGLERQLRS